MENKSDYKRRHKYLLSYFEDEPETPENVQDLILKVMLEDGVGTKDCLCKKRTFLEYLRIAYPKRKGSQLNRQVNNLIRQDVLLHYTHTKTLKYIVRGRQWESRVAKMTKPYSEMTCGELQQEILLGECLRRRNRFIGDHGHLSTIDKS